MTQRISGMLYSQDPLEIVNTPTTTAFMAGGRRSGVGTTGVRGEGSGTVTRRVIDTGGTDTEDLTEEQKDKVKAIRNAQGYDLDSFMSTFQYSLPEENRQAAYDLTYNQNLTPSAAQVFNSVYSSDEFTNDVQRAIQEARNQGITADVASDFEIKQRVMNAYGIPWKGYGTSETGAIEFKDGQFKYVQPWKDTGAETAAMAGAAIIATPLITPYVSAAVGTTGLTGATATAVTKGVTNAIVQQAVTGDVDLKGVALASLGGAVEGANEAAANAQANLDNLNEIANSNIAGEALIAQTQLASATEAAVKANATAEILNNIQTTVDIVEAVENKNIIKAVDLGLSMSGSETVSSIVKDNLTTAGVPADYLDTATSTVIKAADTAIKGGDVGDVVQASVNNVLIESVVTEDNIRNTFNLDTTGFDDTLTKTLHSLSVEALEGGNREDILVKGLESFIENLPESTKETPESLQAIENWWHENIEDPFENWWQDIESQRNVVEQAFNETVETVKQVGQDALDAADAAVRAVPTTKEQWNEVEDAYHENIEDPAEEFVQGLNDGFEGSDSPDVDVETPDVDLDLSLDGLGGGSVGDADIVNVILEDPELVSGFQYEELYNPLMGERTI